MDEATFTAHIKKLVPGYRASQQVRAKLAGLTMIPVVGPTSVGKSTIIELSGVPLAVSVATRQPRDGEVDGVDNFFRRDFAAIIDEVKRGEFVQIAIGSEGDFKGTTMASYPESGAAATPIIAAAVPIFFTLGFNKVIPVFITPPSIEVWRERLQDRRAQDSPQHMEARIHEAAESCKFALADGRVEYVVNDTKQQAVADFLAAIAGTYPAAQNRRAMRIAASVSSQISEL